MQETDIGGWWGGGCGEILRLMYIPSVSDLNWLRRRRSTPITLSHMEKAGHWIHKPAIAGPERSYLLKKSCYKICKIYIAETEGGRRLKNSTRNTHQKNAAMKQKEIFS